MQCTMPKESCKFLADFDLLLLLVFLYFLSLFKDNQKRFRMPEYYFRPEPRLEGLTSSQDLQLFREAQAKMREQLVSKH